ncbi:MotA/TolQ/ExbB proton channel family protein [Ketobacter sp. MCCC 1A13808]|uniref:MotA/TolQ/ExbB proton channel family protein n=1 Tax=Ketobacter sp. MCCC 1A13808 TaxID=2602738 RepID=UPI0012EC3087|nr:MotA/TolQ/ExbB proton channel family protein [Ketobacter sp. MCCC 1A13808]MVF12147.1 MotA/TolQ/ExbB proton channel family protein [Ketobacter sp. MCCC 1A13808]
MIRTLTLGTLLVSLTLAGQVMAAPAANLDQLLNLVKQGKTAEAKENSAREARFRSEKSNQASILAQAKQDLVTEEKRSVELETQFEKQELETAALQEALNKRLGSLKELFGVLQQAAGDTTGQFETSIISSQFENRGDYLTKLAKKMGTSSELASIEEIERLWFELQREMTESGNVVKFNHSVIDATGQEKESEVIRVGTFNLVADGKYLKYDSDTGKIAELIRQPSARFVETAEAMTNAAPGQLVEFGLDPSRGTLLSALIKEPNVKERVEQGGLVGFIIIGVGIISMLIALERIITLSLTRAKVRAQTKSTTASLSNPLGRVLSVYQNNPKLDPDTLELKLAEAIIKEKPRLERFIPLLKIIAVAAPLLGLLGTVIGMIVTFQSITLFGTGDPKLMAGGISQALITTVLGLLVALPTLFFHSISNSIAKNVLHILEEQSAGVIAERMEQEKDNDVRAA